MNDITAQQDKDDATVMARLTRRCRYHGWGDLWDVKLSGPLGRTEMAVRRLIAAGKVTTRSSDNAIVQGGADLRVHPMPKRERELTDQDRADMWAGR